MKKDLYFMSDAFFKYCLGKNNPSSQLLRNFVLKNVLQKEYKDLTVKNPELIPEMINQKNMILDILLEGNLIKIGIDMQATRLSRHLYKRFQQYLTRLCSEQVVIGEEYGDIRETVMILFVKDYNDETPSLIIEKTMIDEKYHIPLPYGLTKLIIVQLPYIEKIVKDKEVINEFEALIYLIYKNTLEGIKYEEKEGVIRLMEEKKETYINEEPALYEATKQRNCFTIDWDYALKDAKEEWLEKGIDQGLEQGLEQGVIMMILEMIKERYHEDASDWLHQCTIEQMKRIPTLCFLDLTYEELKNKVIRKENCINH